MVKVSNKMRGALLGFPDEVISEKYENEIDFTVNKIGGKPDFPNGTKWEIPLCPSCQLPRPLIVQIYAPLEKSEFHRTLYLFGCINPLCWGKSECWLCIRLQTNKNTPEAAEERTKITSKPNATEWCSDANDWDVDDNINVFKETTNPDRIINETSSNVPVECDFANLSVDEGHQKVKQSGTVEASAEIEDVESNSTIILETTTLPESNLLDLLKQASPLPHEIIHGNNASESSCAEFVPYFMAVWQESACHEEKWACVSNSHVLDLLKNYEEKIEKIKSNVSEPTGTTLLGLTEVPEDYEKNNPLHGDMMFHHFLSKIQANPGQILRYDRDAQPLLLYPISNLPTKCQYCQGTMTFEFQLIPTIISYLQLVTDPSHVSRLEFGTVIVYSCRNSCWSPNSPLRAEVVISQEEMY